jgi:hypothetical protein
MKPLVLYCRWHEATLRLRGRDKAAVWGELAYKDGSARLFRFDLNHSTLVLEAEKAAWQQFQLDEQGVVTSTSTLPPGQVPEGLPGSQQPGSDQTDSDQSP